MATVVIIHAVYCPQNLVWATFKSQSIDIISATVSWPILDGLRKPIQSCFPDMWCDSSVAGVDRNEQSDKEVQTLPVAERQTCDRS